MQSGLFETQLLSKRRPQSFLLVAVTSFCCWWRAPWSLGCLFVEQAGVGSTCPGAGQPGRGETPRAGPGQAQGRGAGSV